MLKKLFFVVVKVNVYCRDLHSIHCESSLVLEISDIEKLKS